MEVPYMEDNNIPRNHRLLNKIPDPGVGYLYLSFCQGVRETPHKWYRLLHLLLVATKPQWPLVVFYKMIFFDQC